MSLPKRYNPRTAELELQAQWNQTGTYHFDDQSTKPVYSIDTPPATVSGNLHLGHTFSYSHPDFIARFWRMNGFNVFYPMGFDDNGLPTDRLVERQLGIHAEEMGRSHFIDKCLELSVQAENEYQELWQRLGLSIDWRYTYRTIDKDSRHIAQLSFLKLYQQGLIFRKEAPTIWCPECHTAVAQAELDDLEQHSEFITIRFKLESGDYIEIATTRPELLPACVAIFIHPDDERHQNLVGQKVQVPIFGQLVPVLADINADPHKGTGIVMCCTFGDQTDVAWWHTHQLPLVEAINKNGILTSVAGQYANLSIQDARQQIKNSLQETNQITDRSPISHTVRVHERCDTPVEYIITRQWFVKVLDFKEDLINAGEQVNWHPSHMISRYRAWVENLNWDWCISRQRYYGVPFPVWFCISCGHAVLAMEEDLPVEPLDIEPTEPCPKCGGTIFEPDHDVMDTWATSSLTPQIAGQWLTNPDLYQKVFPYSLRPQAHEIIRTWAFYTLVKSKYHFNEVPWRNALISGWGIAGEGMGKISKSRGGGPMPPMEMIQQYSADAVRYWAASTGPGKDAIISEEKIILGGKLVNKIWNVARFSARFLVDYTPSHIPESLTLADQWLFSKLNRLIQHVTSLYKAYDYAAAKAETESFFWNFADNYLEMAKQRLYDDNHSQREAAQFTLYHSLLTVLKLFAPILPHVTERIYQGLFVGSSWKNTGNPFSSIHTSDWPKVDHVFFNETAENLGDILLEIATGVRRFKSERNLSLGTELKRVQLAAGDSQLRENLANGNADLMSITRALQVEYLAELDSDLEQITLSTEITIGIEI
jgi:valyl-tRNA synthetase